VQASVRPPLFRRECERGDRYVASRLDRIAEGLPRLLRRACQLSNVSISNIDREVRSYDELFEDIQLDENGFATEEMVIAGKELFPDAPGQQTGAGYSAARALIRDAIDDWLRTRPPVPLNQISWPPSAC
jgi:hypothetical protein